MRIAVCDDEIGTARSFSDKIREISSESEISIFTSGNDLIQSDIIWDIVFLDIELGVMNGFQTAKILKTKQPACILSFITSHAELAVDGYDYQPFRYILKTAPELVKERKITETIDEYYLRRKSLSISYKGTSRSVMISDIQWIEICGHNMKLIFKEDTVLWSKSLNEVEKEFENYGLIRCHRSFIVALSQIKEFTSKNIKTKNGYTIPIGRTYIKRVKEKYKNFILTN